MMVQNRTRFDELLTCYDISFNIWFLDLADLCSLPSRTIFTGLKDSEVFHFFDLNYSGSDQINYIPFDGSLNELEACDE